jgi:hypothetical protein
MNKTMKKIRNRIVGLTMSICLLSTTSCDLFELDINKNPSAPSEASVSLLLTNVELNASATFAGGLNDTMMGFVGLTTSTDDFNMNNSSWNNTWNYLYYNPFKDLQGIIDATAKQRAEGAANPHYEGIAKTLKAFYFGLMVDLWGDVPYSQAFRGDAAEQVLAPTFDDDKAIYDNCLALLDEAIAHFAEKQPVTVKGDVIYGGSAARWTAAAKSIKLKLLLNMSRSDASAVPKINALIADATKAAELIDVASEDFQFRFGTLTNPDDRHPMYKAGYAGGLAAYTYFGHQFMYEMLANDDPRRPFYFKRQTTQVLSPDDATQKQTMPCSQRTDCKYGYFPRSNFVANGVFGVDADQLTDNQKQFLAGFFGRDRSDPSGVPNDAAFRTNVGVYPAGGLYDDGAEAGGGNKGRGNGIFPMLTSWMVKLHMIEAILVHGSPGDARALFQAAMEEQMDKVSNEGTTLDADADPIDDADRDDYIANVMADYDAASGSSAKLRVVLKQAWFMNFGNGYEVYNAFRRTGYPGDLQIPLQRPRQFALRLPYALDEVNLNSNTPTVVFDSPANAVFWDVLKFQF